MTEIIYDFTRPSRTIINRACDVCHGWGSLYEDEDGYLFVTCTGPCNGSGFMDLPVRESGDAKP